jgi:ribosome maturation factor RimP
VGKSPLLFLVGINFGERVAEGRKMDLGHTARQIVRLLEPELATEGYDLLDVRIYQGGGRIQVRVYVDLLETEEGTGINMKQVARASRSANMLLEEADLFLGNYIVEVSSPGIRRPLRKPAHFKAVLGQKIEVVMWGKSHRVKGVLTEVGAEKIVVELPSAVATAEDGTAETVALTIERIYEANLDIDFDAQALINADRRQRKDEKRQKRQEKQTKRRGRPKAPKGQKTESPADGGQDKS